MIFSFFKKSYQKLADLFQKAGNLLRARIYSLFQKGAFNEEKIEELEAILCEADIGLATTARLIQKIKSHLHNQPHPSASEIIGWIKEEMLQQFQQVPSYTHTTASTPHVILVVGVNGSGKTTSIAKLAHFFMKNKQKVMVAAADTFRAAAVEQLAQWSEKVGFDLVRSQAHADPAAVAFDAVQAAKARQADYVIIDTAGRLENKSHLMKELEKIVRVIQKQIPQAPHDTLLIIDATAGQNALDQAQAFHAISPLSGIVLSKLDGHAKGGAVVSIQHQLQVPIAYIGLGEKQEDLELFDAKQFIEALFT